MLPLGFPSIAGSEFYHSCSWRNYVVQYLTIRVPGPVPILQGWPRYLEYLLIIIDLIVEMRSARIKINRLGREGPRAESRTGAQLIGDGGPVPEDAWQRFALGRGPPAAGWPGSSIRT